jgi:hypothetical protein
MIPTATATASRSVPVAAYDRVFYSGVAVLMAIIVFVGFAQTFYMRSYFGAPTTITGATTLVPMTILHGLVFTSWVVLFVVQTALVASRRVAVHRRLGTAGVVLAAMMAVLGLTTAFAAAGRGSTALGFTPIEFLAIPFFDIVLFVGFVTAAVLRRREKEAHKRLMLLAYVAIIPAAVARIPGAGALGPGLFILAFGFAAAGAAYDYWSRHKVSSIYWWGLAILVLSVPGRIAVSSTPAWQSFAGALVSR